MERMIGGIVVTIGTIGFVILMFLIIRSQIEETQRARIDCEVIAGGHFINQRGRECWSLDGTRRLFPSEKF